MMAKYKRRITLIKPAFQLKVIVIFFGIALSCMVIQAILMAGAFTAVDPEILMNPRSASAAIRSILVEKFVVSLGILIPFSLAVGVVLTFRIAGPIHRFEQYLKGVAEGRSHEPCRIRAGDELKDLCERINDAVHYLRGQAAAAGDEPGGEEAAPLRRVV